MSVLQQLGTDTFTGPTGQDIELVNPALLVLFRSGKDADYLSVCFPYDNAAASQQVVAHPAFDFMLRMRRGSEGRKARRDSIRTVATASASLGWADRSMLVLRPNVGHERQLEAAGRKLSARWSG